MRGTELLPHYPLRGSLPRWGKHSAETEAGVDSPGGMMGADCSSADQWSVLREAFLTGESTCPVRMGQKTAPAGFRRG